MPTSIQHKYIGKKENINIIPRLINKYKRYLAFESHLQTYIVQIIGRGINKTLDSILLNGSTMEWLGNEVSCGVGMQRIDVMLSTTLNERRLVTPIELKAVEASERNVNQIQRYVDWLEQYYIPNRISDIQPVLIAKKTMDKTTHAFKVILDGFAAFNAINSRCLTLKYIEYELIDNDLRFISIYY